MAIIKNNMKKKNRGKDSFISGIRMPFEGGFSKMSKIVRYIGLEKARFQGVMQSLVHNFKRLIVLNVPALYEA